MDELDKDPKFLTRDGIPYFKTNHEVDPGSPYDRDWIKTAFMVTDQELESDPDDVSNRYWSTANNRFTDTRLGCSIGINPRPQFTRYADIRVKGRLHRLQGGLYARNDVTLGNASGNYGLGRAYAEGYEEPAQRIYLRFGVPQYNGMLNFLTNAFDREQTILARTGRAPTAFYTLAKTAGTLWTFSMFPMFTIGVGAGKAAMWLFGGATSKFFTLKPSMHTYWTTVNMLVNNHAINEGIFKKILSDENDQKLGRPYKLDNDQLGEISALMPDVFSSDGYFDIYQLSTKAQRIANALFVHDFDYLEKGNETNFTGYLKKAFTGKGAHDSYITNSNGDVTLVAMLNRIATSGGNYYTRGELEGGEEKDTKPWTENQQELDPRLDPATGKPWETKPPHIDAIVQNMHAVFKDGADFAVFYVNHTGSSSESFSNSYAESDLAQRLNRESSKFREMRFSIQDGALLGSANPIQSAISGAINVAMGALDGLTLGFAGLIPGLGGSGYLDIPKHWQDSSASLPRGSYTIQLRSPYGNPISRMINIWIPFYMLLAGALPRSAGKQAYTFPYYCQCYDRGRFQSRLCAIESLSVTRGVSNQAFSIDGKAFGLDVSLNLVDLSTIMHAPVANGVVSDVSKLSDPDNILTDYLSVLAGMDIYSQIYPIPRAQLKATKKLISAKMLASPAWQAAAFKNSMEDGWLSDLTFGATSGLVTIIEGAHRGASITQGVLGET